MQLSPHYVPPELSCHGRGSCRPAALPVLGAKSTLTWEAPARRAGRPRRAPPAQRGNSQ